MSGVARAIELISPSKYRHKGYGKVLHGGVLRSGFLAGGVGLGKRL